jgi:hypothetical protein
VDTILGILLGESYSGIRTLTDLSMCVNLYQHCTSPSAPCLSLHPSLSRDDARPCPSSFPVPLTLPSNGARRRPLRLSLPTPYLSPRATSYDRAPLFPPRWRHGSRWSRELGGLTGTAWWCVLAGTAQIQLSLLSDAQIRVARG